ncbi:MAG: hypothetical protein ABFD50_05095 [Smithella sp.]
MKKTMFSICFLWIMFTTTFSFALTPRQVIDLKKAGVSERTIQMMIRQEEGKEPYTTIGTREVKDKDGNTVIIYSTGESSGSTADDEEKRSIERAWQMLNNMIINKK